MSKKEIAGWIAGIIGFILPFTVSLTGLSMAGHIAMSIFLLAAFFWMLEPIPIYATSMLVIFLEVLLLSGQGVVFETLGISPGAYEPTIYTDFIGTLANPIIILFLGGFMLADAAVKYNLDKNITRILLKPFGQKPSNIILGLMLVTATLSAFMSNTATTAMMMTVIIPIAAHATQGDPLKIALALSIPFAANIGGMATPIGTPPNAVVIAALNEQGTSIAFGNWMLYALPVVVFMLFATWLLLLKIYPAETKRLELDMKGSFIKSTKAWVLYGVFLVTIVLWITENLHGIKSSIVALIPVSVLTLSNILTKDDIRKLPWEVLWLVAGGIALGVAMKDTGLAAWMVGSIDWGSMANLTMLALFGVVCIVMSNFLSNTVTATLLIPLAISLGTSGVMTSAFSLIVTGLVIGVSASLAMCLPISTPPNAIAISSGMVETNEMSKAGVLIGIIGILAVMISAAWYWPYIIN